MSDQEKIDELNLQIAELKKTTVILSKNVAKGTLQIKYGDSLI